MADLHGVWPALFVPFTPDDEIDYESFRREIAFLADGGCHGVILFALASEPFKYSEAERKELTRVAVEAAAAHDVPLYTSVTHRATVNAVEWAQWFEGAGVDGLMALPPRDGSLDGDDVVAHLRAVGEAVSLPILVQHTSGNAHVSPEAFASLSAEVPNVESYKIEVDQSCPYVESLLEATDGEVDILVGNGGRELVAALDRGADGVVPGGALHELYLDVYDAYRSGDRDAAIETHKDILMLLNLFTGVGGTFINYEKRLLEWRGVFDSATVRSPAPSTEAGTDDLVAEYVERVRPSLDEFEREGA